MKFIDDLSFVNGLDLKHKLKKSTGEILRPVTYHNRTGHYLPESENILQDQALKLNQFVINQEMKINQSKCKVILFNTSRKYDFMPQISFDGLNNLEVVEELKLLGIVFQSNMRWHANTANLCKNGYARLWMLRNLKKHGAGRADLLDVYMKQVRCALELAVPVWNAGISKAESDQLERVQKAAFHIILGTHYVSYAEALVDLKMEKLCDRRVNICLAFAKKAQKQEKFRYWFKQSENSSQPTFTEVPYRTIRYKKSPLPYLTKLLNDN